MDADKLIDELAGLTIVELRRVHEAAAALLAHYADAQQPDYGQPAEPHETYRQEYVRCNNKRCKRCADGGQGHGPYWYAYRREHGKVKKRYVGKNHVETPKENT